MMNPRLNDIKETLMTRLLIGIPLRFEVQGKRDLIHPDGNEEYKLGYVSTSTLTTKVLILMHQLGPFR